MATAIRMPDLGTTVEQVTLAAWLKNPGHSVRRGEALCEVETDKAVSELESVADGVLLKQVVAPGTEIEVGTVIGYVGEEGETVAETKIDSDSVTPQAEPEPKAQSEQGIAASPMVRSLAKRKGVDLTALIGTGPGGQITRADVLKAGRATLAAATRPVSAQATTLPGNQLAVARAIAKSYAEIIPISVFAKVNMAAASALHQRRRQSGQKLCYDAMLIHAARAAMAQAPRFQGYFDNDSLAPAGAVNVGVAISAGEDLFIPVIRNADAKSIEDIDDEVRTFADKAGKRALTEAEMSGATFTISNLGMLPIEAFTAIVPPRQSGILTIGSIDDNQIATVILTVDHRLINGRQAAEFVTATKERMETL